MKKIKLKKIKDKIIFANTVSLVFISFIIILGMTIFLIHTAVEAETKEMDKLIFTVIQKLNNVPTDTLKETYQHFDYADKEYISLAVEKNGRLIYLTNDENNFDFKKFEVNKLETKWDRFIYKRIYTVNNVKYYAIRNFEFMEAHEILYVMLVMFILITISIIIKRGTHKNSEDIYFRCITRIKNTSCYNERLSGYIKMGKGRRKIIK